MSEDILPFYNAWSPPTSYDVNADLDSIEEELTGDGVYEFRHYVNINQSCLVFQV